ncbi:CaiB/BaiF CoA transferase family protein [Hydrocarboniphaga sp.]|uniref:CaiB/BaiF CoA transferase family protein n=1 Tax=Hydrocarboniphaga sp. TaxID=2033016 RepID=UPI003D13DDAE
MSALKPYKVLELSESVAGEYCGKLLADFGADVLKIERPQFGSPTRALGPFSVHGNAPENSGLFAYLNTNKRSVELDLSDAAGIESLQTLLRGVDLVIDDHAPGWLAPLGLDPERFQQAHPQLLLCAITAFGQSPPDDRLHAEDLNVFHASGWGYHTPSGADPKLPPLKGPGRFLASYEAGLEAALCSVAALYERETSGRGQFIDISRQQVLASRVDYVLGQMVAGDMDVRPDRSAFDLFGPAGIFRCADGYAYIWMSAPAHWQALGQLLGEPAWMKAFPERWLERDCTAERVAECRLHIGRWLATQRKDEVSAAAQQLGLTLVAVNNARDLQQSPQYQHRGFFSEVNHPVLGRASYPTVPYKLGATPAQIVTPAPSLGQHNNAVLLPSPSGRGWRAAPGEGAADSKLPAIGSALTPSPLPVGEGKKSSRGGPLAGLRVVELTKVWAGPYAGKLLGFLGAEVIRVESLGSLDVTRTYGVADIDQAPGFQAVNPQKLSVQIDMKTPRGIALLLDLLRHADVVIENLRPGAVDRLGLGYEAVKAVNPGIVYVAMGMWGKTGPLAYQSGYAPCFAALGGVSALVGYAGGAPAGMNVRYADSTFGAAAAYAATVALLYRRHSGVGQFIDVSAVETMSSMIGDSIMDFALNGRITESDGNRHAQMAPHGCYPCRDGGWISIAVASDASWNALATTIGLAGDARFAQYADRKANEDALDALIAQWTAGRDAAELANELQRHAVAAAASQSSVDLVADTHLWASGFYAEVHDAAGNGKTIVGPSWKLTRGAAIRDAAPRLGEHNAYVLGGILGLSAEQQQQLAEAGVTR